MKGEYQSRKTWVRGKEVFIGVDVHKESQHVTVRAEEEEIFHGRIPCHYDVFQKLLDHFKDCNIKVAYEAGPHCYSEKSSDSYSENAFGAGTIRSRSLLMERQRHLSLSELD